MTAIAIYASGDADANLYYATRLLTPDPYLFVQIGPSPRRSGRGYGRAGGRRKIIAVKDLEIGRAREQATVDEVRSQSELDRSLQAAGVRAPGPADSITAILREHRAKSVIVPANFPVQLADRLRERRLSVLPKDGDFWKERAAKTPDEVPAIEKTQAAVEEAVEEAIETIRRSKARGGRLYAGGEALTSEAIRRTINLALMERECVARDTIVACGDQGCDPHNHGTGPLRANQTIIIDVFPRSNRTQYFADMTRTVVKGKASPAVKKLYASVKDAQDLGISRIRAGVKGSDVHREIQEFFKRQGYSTGPRDGKMEGFFHGTGHGVGLEIHEPPWLNPRGERLPEGAVVTVEPGLYYPGIGGVRLEDMVLVRKSDCRNLTRFPKVLEI